jgi:phosphatidylglycerophosphatase A
MGLGYLPVAPGTWASVGAAAVYLALRRLPLQLCMAALAVGVVLVLLLGLALAPRALRIYGRADPGHFVLDEVAGLWLTCLLFPWPDGLAAGVSALVAFRVFDIAKPFPIRRLEKLPGGWGVMLDDLLAAVYAAAALWVLFYGFGG